MSNQLYRPHYTQEVLINNKDTQEILKYKSSCIHYYYIRYGTPDSEYKEITDWKELLHELSSVPEFERYKFEGYKDKKGKVYAYIDYTDKNYNRRQKKVYKTQFISAKTYMEYNTINPKDIRMKELVDELNAEEFIMFLKDNGIGELPLQ